MSKMPPTHMVKLDGKTYTLTQHTSSDYALDFLEGAIRFREEEIAAIKVAQIDSGNYFQSVLNDKQRAEVRERAMNRLSRSAVGFIDLCNFSMERNCLPHLLFMGANDQIESLEEAERLIGTIGDPMTRKAVYLKLVAASGVLQLGNSYRIPSSPEAGTKRGNRNLGTESLSSTGLESTNTLDG